MRKYTVYSYDNESGQIYSDCVEVDDGIKAFAAVVARRSSQDLSFVVAVPGHINEDDGVVFPGDSTVSSETVREQPEVFGEVQDG